jgi:ketosteroid isomerase-like protein
MRLSAWCCAALVAAAVPGCKKKSNEAADQTAAKTTTDQTTAQTGSAAMAPGSAAPAETPKAATPDDMAKRYVECWGVWSAKDWKSFESCYAKDVTSEFVDSGMPPVTSWQQIMERDKMFTDAFPDSKGQVEVTLINGKNGATFALITGTQTAPMKTPAGEVPATNKKIGIQVAHAVHFADDGKSVDKEWFYQDMGEVMGQLGVSKAPVRAASDKPWHDNEVMIAKDDDTEKKNLATVNQSMDAFNKHDAKALGETFDDKIQWSEQGIAKDWTSKAEAVKAHEALIKAFSDIKFTTDTAWAAGDYVVVQGAMTGTNDGAAPDMGLAKPTKKPVNIRFAQLFKLKDGKITNSWGYWNSAAMAQQLGMMPPAGGAKGGETKPADKPAKK